MPQVRLRRARRDGPIIQNTVMYPNHNHYRSFQGSMTCQAKYSALRGQDEIIPPKNVLEYLIKKAYNICQPYWWRLNKYIRSIIEGTTIYVLECENDKYYVGSTTHKKQRYKQHWGPKGGSKWTKLHKPIRVLKQYTRVPAAYTLGLEAQVTAELMLQFGINNVRGAMFSHSVPYTMDKLDALTGFIGHYNQLRYDEVAVTLKNSLPPSTTTTSFAPTTIIEIDERPPQISKTSKWRKKNKKKKKRRD